MRVLNITLIFCVLASPVSAATLPSPSQGLHITQEMTRNNGVLVSRPRTSDRRILEIMDTHRIRNIEDYARWLKTNVAYLADGPADNWASPEETLNRRQGDCEDFAFLNAAVTQVLGYRPRLLAMVKKGRAHALCAFELNGEYIWFDNARMNRSSARSIQELSQIFKTQYGYTHLLELDPQTKRWSVLKRG